MIWIVDVISIIFALILGIVTTFEDVGENKIRNKWVFSAVAIAVILQLFRIFLTFGLGYDINLLYYKQYIVNLFLTLTLGLVLWELNLWSPADAKLFLAFASLIPLSIYTYGFIDYFPSFVLLINSFTPASAFYLASVIINSSRTRKLKSLKKTLNPRSLTQLCLLVFSFSWLIRIILTFFGVSTNIGITIMLLFFIMMIIEKLKVEKLYYMAALLRLIFDPQILNLEFLSKFIITVLFLIILRYLTEDLSLKSITRLVPASSIQSGMLAMIQGRIVEITEQNILSVRSSGKRIRVLDTIPFAPLLFIGVILTLVFKGNFLVALRTFIGN